MNNEQTSDDSEFWQPSSTEWLLGISSWLFGITDSIASLSDGYLSAGYRALFTASFFFCELAVLETTSRV